MYLSRHAYRLLEYVYMNMKQRNRAYTYTDMKVATCISTVVEMCKREDVCICTQTHTHIRIYINIYNTCRNINLGS